MTVSGVRVRWISGIIKSENGYAPLLKKGRATFDTERLKEVCNHFDSWFESSDDFFRNRIFCQIAFSSCIISASFTPKQFNKSGVLFFQTKQFTETIGFFAPYLSEKDRSAWKAQPYLPGPQLLNDDASLSNALAEIGAAYQKTLSSFQETAAKVNTYYADVFLCVKYFFQDPLSSTMTLSYIEPNGRQISRTWVKTENHVKLRQN
jgi:hypothetical protein